MSAQQTAVAVWKALESAGVKPTIKAVALVLRQNSHRFSDRDLHAWLAPFRNAAQQRAVSAQSAYNEGAVPAQSPADAYAREKEVSLVSKPASSVEPGLKSPVISIASARSKNSQVPLFTETVDKKRPPSTAWVDTLTDRIPALYPKRMVDLTFDERMLLGQYHALKFGNCTKSERVNLSRARTLAASFARMATHPDLADRTVEWYLRRGNLVWMTGGRTAWFKPFDVLAAVTYEADTG